MKHLDKLEISGEVSVYHYEGITIHTKNPPGTRYPRYSNATQYSYLFLGTGKPAGQMPELCPACSSNLPRLRKEPQIPACDDYTQRLRQKQKYWTHLTNTEQEAWISKQQELMGKGGRHKDTRELVSMNPLCSPDGRAWDQTFSYTTFSGLRGQCSLWNRNARPSPGSPSSYLRDLQKTTELLWSSRFWGGGCFFILNTNTIEILWKLVC